MKNKIFNKTFNMISLAILLLSSLQFIDCRPHFCQALKDKNGTIRYGISVPDGTSHHKFVVIGDHFWKLDFGESPDAPTNASADQSTSKAALFVANKFGTKSTFLDVDHDFGFAVRLRLEGDESSEWTKTVVGLIKANPANHYVRAEPIDRTADSLPLEDTKEGNLGIGFKPNTTTHASVAFNDFSRQYDIVSVVVEQTLSGRNNPKYNLKYESAWTELKNNYSGPPYNPPPPKVPAGVEKVLQYYKVKGLYGVEIPNESEPKKNGTAFLIESCVAEEGPPPPVEECSGKIVYLYCAASNADDNPMQGSCNPAVTNLHKLIDCSNEEEWVDTEGDVPTPAGPGDTGPPNGEESDPNNTATPNQTNFVFWIILIIIVIIVVLVMIFLLMLFLRKKSTDTAAEEAPKEDAAKLVTVRSKDATSAKAGPSGSQSSVQPRPSMAKGSKASSVKSESLSIPSVRSSINKKSPKDKAK